MRILGIDSSTPGCSVALLNNDTIVAERIADPKPSYSKYLLQMVDQVLNEGKSLEALACTLDAPEHPICTVLDARKSEVYAAVFESQKEGLHPLIKESALSPEALCEKIKVPMIFIGNGVDRYCEVFKESLGKRFIEPEAPLRFSTAAGTALLASRQFDHQHHFDLSQLKINYIRKSEAELSLGR